MAAQTIRSMIASQIDSPLQNARAKLKEEGGKKLYELKDQLPSVQELKDNLRSDECSLEGQDKMTERFTKIKNSIDAVLAIIEASMKALNSIKQTLDDIINKILSKIQGFIDIFKPIISALKTVLRVIPTVLGAIPTSVPGITAGVLFKLRDILKKAQEFIGEHEPLMDSIEQFVPNTRKKVEKVIEPFNKIVSEVNKFNDTAEKVGGVSDLLFLSYVQECNAIPNKGDGSIMGVVNPPIKVPPTDETVPPVGGSRPSTSPSTTIPISNEELSQNKADLQSSLQEMYGDLLNNMTDVKVIERLQNTEFNFQRSYKVVTKPLDEIFEN